MGSAGFRAISMFGTLLTVPLVLDTLGNVRYGALVVITQLATLLAFSDLGVGNGLVSSLARALAEQDENRGRALVSGTWVLLTGAAAVGVVVALLTLLTVDWSRALGLQELPAEQVRTSVAVFAGLFLLGIPASIAQKIHLAHQEGLQASLWQALGALLTIAATLACVAAGASLPWFVAAGVGGTSVAAILNCSWLVLRRPSARPQLQTVNRDVLRFLAGSGGLFLVLATAAAVAYQTDALVISHLLGPDQVTVYHLVARLFLLPGLVVGLVLAPLWPAFSDAFGRGDLTWARETFHKAILGGAAVMVPSAVLLVLFGRTLIDLWVGAGQTEVPLDLLLAFGAWVLVGTLSGPFAMLLNGAHVLGFQAVCSIAMAVVNVALSLLFTSWWGVSGPVIATVVAQVSCITLPSLVYVRRLWDAPPAPL